MTADDIITATGLDPGDVVVNAFAPPLNDEHPAALLSGLWRGQPLVIIAMPNDLDILGGEGFAAYAITSTSPKPVYDQLTEVMRERLRGESQVPTGSDTPVGQQAAIKAAEAKSQAVPYAPPLPPPDTAESVQSDAERPEGEIDVQPAACGNPECFVMDGPEGKHEVHVEQCPAGSPD